MRGSRSIPCRPGAQDGPSLTINLAFSSDDLRKGSSPTTMPVDTNQGDEPYGHVCPKSYQRLSAKDGDDECDFCRAESFRMNELANAAVQALSSPSFHPAADNLEHRAERALPSPSEDQRRAAQERCSVTNICNPVDADPIPFTRHPLVSAQARQRAPPLLRHAGHTRTVLPSFSTLRLNSPVEPSNTNLRYHCHPSIFDKENRSFSPVSRAGESRQVPGNPSYSVHRHMSQSSLLEASINGKRERYNIQTTSQDTRFGVPSVVISNSQARCDDPASPLEPGKRPKGSNSKYDETQVNLVCYLKDDLALKWPDVLTRYQSEYPRAKVGDMFRATAECVNSRYYRGNKVPRRTQAGDLIRNHDGKVIMKTCRTRDRFKSMDKDLNKDYYKFVSRCPEAALNLSWVLEKDKIIAKGLMESRHFAAGRKTYEPRLKSSLPGAYWEDQAKCDGRLIEQRALDFCPPDSEEKGVLADIVVYRKEHGLFPTMPNGTSDLAIHNEPLRKLTGSAKASALIQEAAEAAEIARRRKAEADLKLAKMDAKRKAIKAASRAASSESSANAGQVMDFADVSESADATRQMESASRRQPRRRGPSPPSSASASKSGSVLDSSLGNEQRRASRRTQRSTRAKATAPASPTSSSAPTSVNIKRPTSSADNIEDDYEMLEVVGKTEVLQQSSFKRDDDDDNDDDDDDEGDIEMLDVCGLGASSGPAIKLEYDGERERKFHALVLGRTVKKEEML